MKSSLTHIALSQKTPSPSEMAELDKRTIAAGISGCELMQRAGQAVFAELERMFSLPPQDGNLCILCGSGNNGGDGFVIGQILLDKKIAHSLILAASTKYSSDLKQQAEKFIKAGGRVYLYPNDDAPAEFPVTGLDRQGLIKLFSVSSLIVDALLGTGQRSAPRGSVGEIISTLCEVKGSLPNCKVFAVDTPSGINAACGKIYHPVLKADTTICIELIKRGMLQYPAREYCGDIITVPIGIDTSPDIEFSLINSEEIQAANWREKAAHKGDFGRLLVIAGSRDMPGAAFLSAGSALRSGAGLVTLAWPSSLDKHLLYPELMYKTLGDGGQGCFCPEMIGALRPFIEDFDAVVIGPGLGKSEKTKKFLKDLLQLCKKPAVVDADALNILSDTAASPQELKGLLPSNCVLTPHPGEMARLLKSSPAEVQADRYSASRILSAAANATVVLKGAATVVYGNGCGRINSSGNPFMATAGSGDVLAGLIGSLLAQGFEEISAAESGVFIHGIAGDIASNESGGLITAGDIIDCIPAAFSKLSRLKELCHERR